MIKRVQVIPKVEFERRLRLQPNFLDSHFAISICDPGEERPFDGQHGHLLKLTFCDVGAGEIPRGLRRKYPCMSRHDALRIIAFVKRCRASGAILDLVVHCNAGISRSGAVGRFAVELLRLSRRQFHKDNPFVFPSPHVIGLLRCAAKLPNARTWMPDAESMVASTDMDEIW